MDNTLRQTSSTKNYVNLITLLKPVAYIQLFTTLCSVVDVQVLLTKVTLVTCFFLAETFGSFAIVLKPTSHHNSIHQSTILDID